MQKFQVLDGLRGCAALLVVEYHAAGMFLEYRPPSSYLAVDLFFLISGFVLAHAYGTKLVQGLTVGRFMMLRLVRLYPLHLLGLVLGVSYATAQLLMSDVNYTGEGLAAGALLTALFLPTPPTISIDPLSAFPINYPVWSLFLELVVNLVFACIAIYLSLGRLVAIVLLSAAALVVATTFHGSMSIGHEWSSFWGGFPRVSFSFFMGVLIYRFKSTSEKESFFWAWMCVLAVILIACVPIATGFRTGYDLLVVLVLFPALLWIASGLRVGSRTAMLFGAVGAASYGIYVLHAPVLMWLIVVTRKVLGVEVSTLAPSIGVVTMVALILSALWLNRYFDEPLRRMIVRKINQRTTTAVKGYV